MPWTTSSSVSKDFASSTVITPSLPTFFIASARNLPISTSPLAEIVPTWAISSLEVTFFEFFCRSATTASTARSMPRLRSIGFMPAATAFEPSFTIACARTVAVVVPSPAKSDDFDATSRTICAPMFSNLSSSSISLATVTPSLVMRGAPYDLSSTTLRPLGPSVTRTALARISTPRNILSRASTPNFTSLAAIFVLRYCLMGQRLEHFPENACPGLDPGWTSGFPQKMRPRKESRARFRFKSERALGRLLMGDGLLDHAHDVALLHDQIFDPVELDLRA